MENIYVFVGRCMQKARINRNLTQKHVADQLGIAVSNLSAYESGKRHADLEFIARWTEAIGVNHRYPLEKWNQYLRKSQNPHPDSSEM